MSLCIIINPEEFLLEKNNILKSYKHLNTLSDFLSLLFSI